MRSKEPITLAVWINSDSSKILPPFFIFLARKPKCFALSTPRDKSNDTSCMVGEYFMYCLEKVWYSSLTKRTSSDLWVLFNNFSAHGDCLPKLSGAKCLLLPPNVTSFYQPLEMELLQAVKVNAWRNILVKVTRKIGRYDELHKLGWFQKAGMKFLDYFRPTYVFMPWDLFTIPTLCWVRNKLHAGGWRPEYWSMNKLGLFQRSFCWACRRNTSIRL